MALSQSATEGGPPPAASMRKPTAAASHSARRTCLQEDHVGDAVAHRAGLDPQHPRHLLDRQLARRRHCPTGRFARCRVADCGIGAGEGCGHRCRVGVTVTPQALDQVQQRRGERVAGRLLPPRGRRQGLRDPLDSKGGCSAAPRPSRGQPPAGSRRPGPAPGGWRGEPADAVLPSPSTATNSRKPATQAATGPPVPRAAVQADVGHDNGRVGALFRALSIHGGQSTERREWTPGGPPMFRGGGSWLAPSSRRRSSRGSTTRAPAAGVPRSSGLRP